MTGIKKLIGKCSKNINTLMRRRRGLSKGTRLNSSKGRLTRLFRNSKVMSRRAFAESQKELIIVCMWTSLGLVCYRIKPVICLRGTVKTMLQALQSTISII